MTFRPELIDELLKDYQKPEDLMGEGGILKQLTKKLVERGLEAEIDDHLETEKAERDKQDKEKRQNWRNGHSRKTTGEEFGEAEIVVPRDRHSEFEPQIVNVHPPCDDGCCVDFVKVRQEGRVINKAIHLALGVNLEGDKELLGLWMTQTETAKFWLSVLTELQNRGVKDILIACIDGLTGFAEAIEAVFAQTRVQLCLVHMVRNSLRYVSYKHRKAVAADRRPSSNRIRENNWRLLKSQA